MKHFLFKWVPQVFNKNIPLRKIVAVPLTNGSRKLSSAAEETRDSEGGVKASAPLFDTHGRRHDYLRISLTERCNLRCQYCMPAEGVALSPRERLLTAGELARLVRVFAHVGVSKLRLTGGEPTVRRDLPDLIRSLRSIPGITGVSMTTNGLVLTRRLPALQAAGLTALNVSLDSLRAERYERLARRPGLARVLAGLDLALQLGYSPVKLNTVLIKGFNDDEILDFVDLTKDRDIEVRFIEFMPFTGNRWKSDKLVPASHVRDIVSAARGRLCRVPGRASDTARRYTLAGHRGAVGFISSMTEPFCGGCNRLRLTADGSLKVCLFGDAELSLRDALRAGASDADLLVAVRTALRGKKAQHAGRCRPAPPPPALPRPANPRLALGYRHGGDRPRPQPTHDPYRRVAARAYSSRAGREDGLTHLDAAGRATMVDVGDKPVSERRAVAEGRLLVSARLLRLLRDARLPKGDAVCVARVAGVMAAKRTADLIPLCHPLPLTFAGVEVRVPRGADDADGAVLLTCEVRTRARTGAEMEALTGCAVAALALYDMCKAVDRDMRLTDLRVVHKSGGRRAPPPPAPAPPPAPGSAPAPPRPTPDPAETYAPTNFMHF